ncbi:MAG: protein kinase domain-containing protein [Planctomycetota bacterium]
MKESSQPGFGPSDGPKDDPPPSGLAAPSPVEGKGAIGPYRILSEIGRGGMGVVYKAYHPELKRTVALKVLIAGEDASEGAISRFHHEAEAVAKLGHHPNIVPIYDIGQVVGAFRETPLHYIAMHYVEGKSLDRMIDDGEITPKQAAVITKKLAEALAHAHSHGILHRDIKPANVLMGMQEGLRGSETPNLKSQIPTKSQIPNLNDTGESGLQPMLTDFGLAKDVASETKITRSGSTIGTPAYMPPEQAAGRLSEIDERSDVYSLGATFYEMLTSLPPFEAVSVIEMIQKVLLSDPKSPRKANPDVDRDLETLCLKCLEKRPEKRFQSARELAKDLGRTLEGRPILARPASTWEKVMKRARRNKMATAGIGVAVLALIAGAVAGGIALWGMRGKAKAEVRAGDAEAKTKETEALLDRSQTVSAVLLGAFGKLGRVHADLKATYYDSTLTASEKWKAFEEHEGDIDAFLETLPPDSASQATGFAVKGWLLHLGGKNEKAKSLLKKAQCTDPEAAWGYLFEAMILLSTYIHEQRIPDVKTAVGGVEFARVPGETPTMKKLRERFESLIGKARERLIWLRGAADHFQDVISAMRGLQQENLMQADAGLTKALSVSELAWLEEEILYFRTYIRYMQKRFALGRADALKLQKRCPRFAALYKNLALLRQGEACEKWGKDGRDPGEFRKAIEDLDKALALAPDLVHVYNFRGTVHMNLGKAEEELGNDARPAYRNAVSEYDEFLRRLPGDYSGTVNRANALLRLANVEAARGTDPWPLFQKAIRDAEEARRLDPKGEGPQKIFGDIHLGMGEAEAARGRDPREHFRKAIGHYRKVRRSSKKKANLQKDLASAYERLGLAEARRGIDPRPSYRKAIDLLEKARRLNPDLAGLNFMLGKMHIGIGQGNGARGEDFLEPARVALTYLDEAVRKNEDFRSYQARAHAHFLLGEGRRTRGETSAPSFRKALADFDEALKIRPKSWKVYAGKAEVLGRLGRFVEQVEAFEKAVELSKGAEPSLKGLLEQARFRAGSPAWMEDLRKSEDAVKRGDFEAMRSHCETALEKAEKAGVSKESPNARFLQIAHLNLASYFALAAEGRKSPRDPPKSLPPAETAQKREEALKHLRKAMDLGWKNPETIWGLPDFQALIKAWRQKAASGK